ISQARRDGANHLSFALERTILRQSKLEAADTYDHPSSGPARSPLRAKISTLLYSWPARLVGAVGSRWASRSSKPLRGRLRGRGWVRLPCASAIFVRSSVDSPLAARRGAQMQGTCHQPRVAGLARADSLLAHRVWGRPGLSAIL